MVVWTVVLSDNRSGKGRQLLLNSATKEAHKEEAIMQCNKISKRHISSITERKGVASRRADVLLTTEVQEINEG